MNYNWAARVPLIGVDKNRVADNIRVKFFVQDTGGEVDKAKASFVGECLVPWKFVMGEANQWKTALFPLSDPEKKCQLPVKGQADISVKWIPAGEEGSKYNAKGELKLTEEQKEEQKV